MKILEIKLAFFALASNVLVDLGGYTSIDLLLKAIPAIVVTGFTLDRWVAFRKRLKKEKLEKLKEEEELND